MRNDEQRGAKSKFLLLPVAVLAIGGLWLAALAGAEHQPTVRDRAYVNTCDKNDGSQSFDTKITKAPEKKTKSTKAKIEFIAVYCYSQVEADQDQISFECSLDGKKPKNCESPISYKKLKPGKHKFSVAALGYKSNPGYGDPSPAIAKWKIDG